MPAAKTTATKRALKPAEDWTPKKVKTYPFTAFGKTWQVHQANVSHLVNLNDDPSISALYEAVTAHVVKAQRVEFTQMLIEVEGMDIDNLMDLFTAIQAKAYPDTPTNPS